MVSTTIEGKSNIHEELSKPSFDPKDGEKLNDLVTLSQDGRDFPEISDPDSIAAKEAVRRRLVEGIDTAAREMLIYVILAEHAREGIEKTDLVQEKAKAENEAQTYEKTVEDSVIKSINLERELSKVQQELDLLPARDRKALMDVIETEARIIQRIAQGRAIWRYSISKPDIPTPIKMELGRAINDYLDTRGAPINGEDGPQEHPINEYIKRGIEAINKGKIEATKEDYKFAEEKYRDFLKNIKDRMNEFPTASAEILADQGLQVAKGAAPNKPIKNRPVL